MVTDVTSRVGDGRFKWHETAEATYLAPVSFQGQSQLRVAFTSRHAGRSGHAFNLSFDRGEHDVVLANRHRLLTALDLGHTTLNSVRQVHGNEVCVVDADRLKHGLTGIEADALLTNLPETPLGVLAADCLPIILYCLQPRLLAVVHAGRMGTYHRIVLATLKVMETRFGAAPETIYAILGPGIGACCYRLDTRAVGPFQERFADWERYFIPQEAGYWMMSLTQANQAQLQAAGVPIAHVQTAELCTACHTDDLFSHRAEGDGAGRGMGVAALLPG